MSPTNAKLLCCAAFWAFGCVASSCADRYEQPELLSLLLAPQDHETPTLLVLGDSLTEYSRGFGLAELLAGSYDVHWKGAPNRDIPYWSMRIPEALSLPAGQEIKILVFPMGTNDAYLYGPAQFSSGLRDFHQRLRSYSNARVYYTMVPRTNDPTLRARILANNSALPAVVAALDRAFLIDLDATFQNRLPATPLYPPSDPIHPNDSGYRLIAETIRAALLLGGHSN